MKLFICNKAGECEFKRRQKCGSDAPHKFKAKDCTDECAFIDGAHCIRYRHPLEVEILKKIALIRSFRECFGSRTENWIAHQMNINLLRDVLKAGRKSNNGKV